MNGPYQGGKFSPIFSRKEDADYVWWIFYAYSDDMLVLLTVVLFWCQMAYVPDKGRARL
jgi:hypothetical protein